MQTFIYYHDENDKIVAWDECAEGPRAAIAKATEALDPEMSTAAATVVVQWIEGTADEGWGTSKQVARIEAAHLTR